MFWIKHRRLILWLLYILFFLHAIAWYCLDWHVIGQLGFGEIFNTMKTGMVTAGTIFILLIFIHALFFGGIFCGWFCHWGVTQDAAAWLMKKCGIKPVMRHLDSKLIPWAWFLILLGQVVVYWMFYGFPKEMSFDMAHTAVWAGNPTAILMIVMTTLISGFILIFLFGERAFCRSICTFRLWFSWFDKIAPYRIRKTHDCGACANECTESCFMDVDVAKEIKLNGVIKNNACVKCFRCMGACPNTVLTASFKPVVEEKNEPVPMPAPQFDKLGSFLQMSMAILALHFFGYTIGGNMSLSLGFLLGFVLIHVWHSKSITVFEILTIMLGIVGLAMGNDTNLTTAIIKAIVALVYFLLVAKYSGFTKGREFLDSMPGNLKTSKILATIVIIAAIWFGSIELLASYNITKALAAHKNGDYLTYVECYEKWAGYHTQPEAAYFDLAKIELLLKRYDQCLDALEKSLDLSFREDLAVQSVAIFLDEGLEMHAKKLAAHLIDNGHDTPSLRDLHTRAEAAVAERKARILGNK